MTNFKTIQFKLEQFIRKYYINALIKGAILFFAIGLLYFLATLLVEYLLWLNTTLRTILFWIFVAVESGLLLRFIAIPLAKLFKIQKGIDYKEASKIIGEHFPEVSDKLLNVIQLNSDKAKTELLIASIDQKSAYLNPIPFRLAINFKNNIRYLKYAAIPASILLVSLATGHINWFSDSYKRVVNYQTAFEPPAPFQFFIINDNLQAVENEEFRLLINTEGEIIPDNVQITYTNETYYLKKGQPKEFEYVFSQLKKGISFQLSANNVVSKSYKIDVIEAPTLLSFDMILDYPSHTKKNDEVLKNTGNAIVPQGTKITWQLKTKATENVYLYAQDTLAFESLQKGIFETSKRLNNSLDYSLNTSNEKIKDYESLAFSINVIRDQHPEIKVQMERDSINAETLYFFGQVSDDYGLSKLQMVYFLSDNEGEKHTESIPVSNSIFDEFFSFFPNQLNLLEGKSYELYFEIFDNDVLNNFKSTKSPTFGFRKLTKKEIEENQLKEQGKSINDINKAIENFEEQDKRLEELSKDQKEKSELNFNDRKKLEDFLERQKSQEEMMQNFNKKLKENLEKFENENNEKDLFKESLEERLKENQEQLEKDEKLLEELQKLAEKIQKEELTQRLEELAKQNSNKKRSLEQLLELTKRYYVSRKAEKLRLELEELAKYQENLSNETQEDNTKKSQDSLSKNFEDFQKELNELHNDNKKLRKPLEIPQDKKGEEDIKNEQQEAKDNLEKREESNNPQEQEERHKAAQKNQKKAAQKMMQMSKKMEQAMAQSGGDQMSEDIDMLRQILDNLVLFSFEQEELMNKFKGIQVNHNEYANHLRTQQALREHFEHIDDSLFALSLRQPMVSELINKEISEIYFNLDKSLVQLSENVLYQGVAAQQFTITSTNTLGSMLSDLLDNLESQMNPSPGQGGKGDMQLPDIIMSQEQLGEQMKEGLKNKEKGEERDDNKEGKKEGNKLGEGEGNSEELNGELFRIYQQQRQLRESLEEKLRKEGTQGTGNNLLRKMEDVEQDLLNKGFANSTLQKMIMLHHELLKLENATFQQGEDNKRQSKTNRFDFNNTDSDQLKTAKQYFNTTEILNRQTLPLQQVYKKKVQDYFRQSND